MKKRTSGFTLIELMIVVAVVTILAAVAIPAYTQYVRKAARHQAQATMLNLAQMEERYYTNNYAYNPVSAPPAVDPNGWSNYSGDSMAGRKYDITVTVPAPAPAPANSYTIQAVPSNTFVDNDCQTLTLDYMGVKGVNTTGTGTVATCW